VCAGCRGVQQLVRNELHALMCLARATDAGGINWPGDLAEKNGLPLDRVAAFLTKLASFIPLEKFAVELPSALARYLASPGCKTVAVVSPAVKRVGVKRDGDEEGLALTPPPADAVVSPVVKRVGVKRDGDEEGPAATPTAKQQKKDDDQKRSATKAKYVAERTANETPTVKRSDTESVRRDHFVENLTVSLQEQHTGQQVMCCVLCAVCYVLCCAVCCVL
jgi:hypothetical protein